MDDMDFEGALNGIPSTGYVETLGAWADCYFNEIQFALALAQKLQSMDFSDEAHELAGSRLKNFHDRGMYFAETEQEMFETLAFVGTKAMTSALIEETHNELQRSDKGVGV